MVSKSIEIEIPSTLLYACLYDFNQELYAVDPSFTRPLTPEDVGCKCIGEKCICTLAYEDELGNTVVNGLLLMLIGLPLLTYATARVLRGPPSLISSLYYWFRQLTSPTYWHGIPLPYTYSFHRKNILQEIAEKVEKKSSEEKTQTLQTYGTQRTQYQSTTPQQFTVPSTYEAAQAYAWNQAQYQPQYQPVAEQYQNVQKSQHQLTAVYQYYQTQTPQVRQRESLWKRVLGKIRKVLSRSRNVEVNYTYPQIQAWLRYWAGTSSIETGNR